MKRTLAALLASPLLACASQPSPPSGARPVAPMRATVSGVPAVPTCKPGTDWHDPIPVPPQRIYGNTWYVGTCGLTALLVTSPAGHVLLDGTTATAAPQIEANVRRLGFRIEDVRYLLTSHAHIDHVGAFAQLKADSGAIVVSRGTDAAAIERGRGDRRDPQMLVADPFPPVLGVRRVADGETLKVGDLAFTAHATPGHTPGSTSWTWDACDSATCLHLAYVDSVSAMTDDVYRYGDEAAHPGVVAAFQASLATIAGLPCDILLTPHPDASDLWLRLGPRATDKLVDPAACRRYAAHAREKLDERLAKERAGTR